jgi:hypothetical protein
MVTDAEISLKTMNIGGIDMGFISSLLVMPIEKANVCNESSLEPSC